ncbi:MAG: CoA-binding protein, partial [Alphaproteobacteria bacterium]
MFKPRSVAIVGASETGGAGWPRAIYSNLEFAGFPTKVYLINPRRDELWGQKVYPDFGSLPEPVDLALTIVPAEAIPGVLEAGARNGLKAALIYAARVGEGGDAAGAKRADAIRALCDEHGLVVCGPNCMGALALPDNLLFYPALRVRGLPKGPVGVVFQSGGTFMFWLQRAAERGLGFSYAVSSGNEINLDLADYINFMVDDPQTTTIACMAEGIRRPDAFMAAVGRALTAEKPVVMLKVGRSDAGKEAAQSHTGALASDDAVLDAVCRKYGVIRAHSLDEMIEHCLVVGQRRWPRGPRTAMVCYSGGGKGLFLDYGADEGAVMAKLSQPTMDKVTLQIDAGLPAQNPIDCGAGMAPRRDDFRQLCIDVAADPGVDIFAVQGHLPAGPDDSGDASVFSGIHDNTDKPVIAYSRVSQNVSEEGRAFQQAARVPFTQGIWQAVRSINGLVGFARALERGIEPLPAANGDPADLNGDGFTKILAGHGLTPPASTLAKTPEDAATAAARIGFPVALKIVSPQAIHKTEVGGVS